MYQIKQWERHFENAASLRIKQCTFACVPNRYSLRLRRLLRMPGGLEAFGLFILLVEECSKQNCGRQGLLTERGTVDSTPMTNEDIAELAKQPVDAINRSMELLTSESIGWIAIVDESAETAPKTDDTQAQSNGNRLPIDRQTGGNQTVIDYQSIDNQSVAESNHAILDKTRLDKTNSVCNSAGAREEGVDPDQSKPASTDESIEKHKSIVDAVLNGRVVIPQQDAQAYMMFRAVYPPNGVFNPNTEKNFFAECARASPSKIIRRAAEFAVYHHARDPDNYPWVDYIPQAENWLMKRQWEVNWKARRKTHEQKGKHDEKRTDKNRKNTYGGHKSPADYYGGIG